MSSKTVVAIATVLLIIIEIIFVTAVGGFTHWWEIALVAPVVLLALMAGLDLTREILKRIWLPKHPEPRGTAILIVCLLVAPIPATLCLYLASLIAPGHLVGTVNGLFEAWRIGTGMTLLHGFLSLSNAPNSFRSMTKAWRDAFANDKLLKG